MCKDSGISMLKTEWKEDFVYKLKELLQLFQSLPSAKMRMRTKIIVQVRFQILIIKPNFSGKPTFENGLHDKYANSSTQIDEVRVVQRTP